MTSVVHSFFQAIGLHKQASLCELDNPQVAAFYGLNRKLMHDRCYFCSCWPCMSDVLFLLDQSALVDPVACSSPLNEFGFTLQDNDKWSEGSKAQIDFTLATIRQMDPARIVSQSVKIAVALYGDSSSYVPVVDFDDWGTNIDNLHCKLYGHDGFPCGENMDDIEFKRRPICGSGGLKNAMIESASYEHQSWRKWDPYHPDVKIRTPIAKILALTAGGIFVGSSFENEEELLSFMRPIHDPIEDGFDFVFPVGMATGEQIGQNDFSRTEEEDIQFWRGMNIIGCLNPEACDYTLMASPSGNNPNGVDPKEFYEQLMQDSFWDKYFCYYRHWNYFCNIQPFERTEYDIARTVRNKRSAKSQSGYKPNSCCGNVPFNDEDETCCYPGNVQPKEGCQAGTTTRTGDDSL